MSHVFMLTAAELAAAGLIATSPYPTHRVLFRDDSDDAQNAIVIPYRLAIIGSYSLFEQSIIQGLFLLGLLQIKWVN